MPPKISEFKKHSNWGVVCYALLALVAAPIAVALFVLLLPALAMFASCFAITFVILTLLSLAANMQQIKTAIEKGEQG